MQMETSKNLNFFFFNIMNIQPSINSILYCTVYADLKVHKIEIFFGFDFEICIISLLVMSKY